jgi:hypothetical protein
MDMWIQDCGVDGSIVLAQDLKVQKKIFQCEIFKKKKAIKFLPFSK